MDDYELYHYGVKGMKWVIPYGDYYYTDGTVNISSISDTGRVTGYTNFKSR